MYKNYTNKRAVPKRYAAKILLIMRLTTVLLISTFMQVSAASYAQKISLKGRDMSLEQVFNSIRLQTGYDFVVKENLLQSAKSVNVNFEGVTIEEALNICFKDQPFTFVLAEKTIIVKQKTNSFLDKINEVVRSAVYFNTISGTVSDSLGNALIGASVIIKGKKTYQVLTDNYGGFQFINVANGEYKLSVTYIGYDKLEKTISAGMVVENLKLVLQQATSKLDQVQVIGYGNNTQRFSVGSVTTIGAAEIEKQPVTNLLLALQGQAPGLAINATSGVPGSRVQLQIRGQNTIMSASGGLKPYDQPLFIIDGVPFAPQNKNLNQLSSLANSNGFNGGISQAGGLSPFNGINPADIESVSILKDADATSIYGTQGSNGVILITTKKGKAGKTNFNLTANTGFNTAIRQVELLSTAQYLQVRKDAFAADNITPTTVNGGFFSPGFAPDLLIFDQNKYTDWQKDINGKTSNSTDIHATLSGGALNNTFLFSGGYTRSNVNFPGDYSDQRFTMHSNLHHSSANNRLSIDFGSDFGYDQNNTPSFGGSSRILLPPNLPDLVDSQGNLVWSYKGIDLSSYQFNAYLKNSLNMQNYNLNNTLRLTYKIVPGLSVSANVGYNRNTSSEHSESPGAAQNPSRKSPSASFTTNNFQTLIAEPQIDYTYTSGRGVLTALLGGTYKKNLGNSSSIQGIGYANDNFLGSINGAATKYVSDGSDIYKYSAGFARLKYVYDQKYIVSLTGRRDGSSNFGPGRQFGNFGSVGLGWIFSEEKFLKTTLPFISYAKLSGSYGTSGSDGVQSYQYQSFWQPLASVPAFQGVQPNVPVNLFNSDYSWALKKSLNTAVDLGLFHDRILLNATYYRNRIGNQLGTYPLPGQVGLTTVTENLPASLQNSGWEFSMSSNNVKTQHFSWTTNFNISFNRNKLLSFPNLEASSYRSQYVIGKPTSIIMAYQFKGVNETTGLFEYYKKDGTITSTPKYGLAAAGGDMAPIADREIKYMGGFGNNLSYKNFSLYVFFQFSSQTAPNYLATIYGNYTPGISLTNVPVEALDYWKKPGDQTSLQKLSVSYFSAAASAAGAFGTSTGAYSDDTYVRLKTVSLSYKLPDTFLKKMHVGNASIYANAQNLLTITNFKVADPEQFGDFSAFPLQRTVVFGLNFNF